MLSQVNLKMPGIVHQLDEHTIELEVKLAPMPKLFTNEGLEAMEDALGIEESDFLCDKMVDEITRRSILRKVRVGGVRPANGK